VGRSPHRKADHSERLLLRGADPKESPKLRFFQGGQSIAEARSRARHWASLGWTGLQLRRQRFDAQAGQWLDTGQVPLVE
jgi:hypothetical protein